MLIKRMGVRHNKLESYRFKEILKKVKDEYEVDEAKAQLLGKQGERIADKIIRLYQEEAKAPTATLDVSIHPPVFVTKEVPLQPSQSPSRNLSTKSTEDEEMDQLVEEFSRFHLGAVELTQMLTVYPSLDHIRADRKKFGDLLSRAAVKPAVNPVVTNTRSNFQVAGTVQDKQPS